MFSSSLDPSTHVEEIDAKDESFEFATRTEFSEPKTDKFQSLYNMIAAAN